VNLHRQMQSIYTVNLDLLLPLSLPPLLSFTGCALLAATPEL
jgi:hypothetical protein